MNILRCATHVVIDPAASARRAQQWLGYRTIETGVVSDDLAASWATPATAGRDVVLCQPASGADGYLRFVAGEPVADYRPIRTFGWAAVELCVEDVLAVDAAVQGAPYAVIGTPSQIPGLTTIHPMQVRGPDAETIYLTQILTDAREEGLPRNVRGIDRPFILVFACADIAATAGWFAATLGLRFQDPIAIRYRMIAQAFGLPVERLHRIAPGWFDGDVCIELSQYPDAATQRPAHPGALPPGFAIGTFAHPAFDAIPEDWITPPVARGGPLYRDRRVGTLRTPEGALVEMIEA